MRTSAKCILRTFLSSPGLYMPWRSMSGQSVGTSTKHCSGRSCLGQEYMCGSRTLSMDACVFLSTSVGIFSISFHRYSCQKATLQSVPNTHRKVAPCRHQKFLDLCFVC